MSLSSKLLNPPAGFKSFAGPEFLTRNGQISLWAARHRIELYVRANTLERGDGFALDAELQFVLDVQKDSMTWAELEAYFLAW
jgi:hypothetical protein